MRQGDPPWRVATFRGEGGVKMDMKMKMDSDVLLLSYLDKICLILTGELWRALACLYSEARLYKGARVASLSQSTTLLSTGNTIV